MRPGVLDRLQRPPGVLDRLQSPPGVLEIQFPWIVVRADVSAMKFKYPFFPAARGNASDFITLHDTGQDANDAPLWTQNTWTIAVVRTLLSILLCLLARFLCNYFNLFLSTRSRIRNFG